MIGIFIGFAFGITLTTVMWSFMLMKGGKRRAENDKLVEALLVRKAEGIERIALILETSVKPGKVKPAGRSYKHGGKAY